MALPKLYLLVPQEGYSLDDGDAVLRAKVSSGPSRMRLDMLDAPMAVAVALVLEPQEFNYWRAFHRTTIARGSLPFLMDLMIDSPDVAEYQVQIVPGSVKTGVQGTAHLVQMELEVSMSETPPTADYDTAIVMLQGLYGARAPNVLLSLEKLANHDLPRV